ncbi:MAG: hypothetical protein ACLPYS_16025 [Vulcanimicrobiaceae bacterium]
MTRIYLGVALTAVVFVIGLVLLFVHHDVGPGWLDLVASFILAASLALRIKARR